MDKLTTSHDQDGSDWVVRLCRAVREILGADRVSVWLYDVSAQAVYPYASDGLDDRGLHERAEKWPSTPLDRFPAARTALLERSPVTIEKAGDDDRLPQDLAADFAIDSIHFEPLAAGRPVGLLLIEPASAAARNDLKAAVPLVASSAESVLSEREPGPQKTEAEFLLELTEAAMGEQSLTEMLATVCDRVARQIGVRRACIFLHENGRMVPRMASYADGSRDPAAWQKFRRAATTLPAVEAAMHSGKPIVVEDPSSPLIAGWWAETFNLASAVAVPLGKRSNTIGVLTLDSSTPRGFSKEDVRLAAAAASHIASIIERARASDERAGRLRAATAIRRLLEEGARATSVRQAGEVLARVTRDALGAEHATLFLGDEEEHIAHVITVGVHDRFEAILREQLVGSKASDFRIWRLTTRQPKPIFVENAKVSRLAPPELVEMLRLKSYVALPLLSADRPLGLVFCTHSAESKRWSSEQRDLVAQLALEGSLIVESAALRAAERERMDELAHQAFHDPLTELPNRVLFADRLAHALARTQRREESVAVLFLDLDRFKLVNDNLGHDAGDQLLIAVAQRLQACLRPEDTVARIGGDEFTVLLEDITDLPGATRVADRIAECLRTPFVIDGHELTVTTSTGIALSTQGETRAEGLLRNADLAMYHAKRTGMARYEVFNADTFSPPFAEPFNPEDPALPDERPSITPSGSTTTPPSG